MADVRVPRGNTWLLSGLGPEDPAVKFDDKRYAVVAAIATLPDEAFGWLAGVLDNIARTAGGFRPDSRAALEAIAPLTRTYFARQQEL